MTHPERDSLLDKHQIEDAIGAPSAGGLYRSLVDVAEFEPEQKGLLTGLTYLDKLTGGLRSGKLNLTAAFSSHGKTSLMMTIGVANMAEETPWLFFTADDTDDTALARVLAMYYDLTTEEVELKGPKWRAARAQELEGQLLVCAPHHASTYQAEELMMVYEEVTEYWGRPPAYACFDYLSMLGISSYGDDRNKVVAQARALKRVARQTDDTVWMVGHQCIKSAGAECPALLMTHLEYGGHQEADGIVFGCRRRIDTTPMKDWEMALEEETPTTNISIMKNKVTGKKSPNPIGTVYVIDARTGMVREMTEEEKRLRDQKGETKVGPYGGVKFSTPTLSLVQGGDE